MSGSSLVTDDQNEDDETDITTAGLRALSGTGKGKDKYLPGVCGKDSSSTASSFWMVTTRDDELSSTTARNTSHEHIWLATDVLESVYVSNGI